MLGVLGVGTLASALVRALQRAHPALQFPCSPRNARAVALLQTQAQLLPQASNQQVVDACDWLIIGVRPAQLQTLAQEVVLTPAHHLLVLSAGTPLAELQTLFAPARVTRLMAGLAVAGGQGTISCYPPDDTVQAQWQAACATFLPFEREEQFEASMLAVCANAWWLDQLASMAAWLVQATGMPAAQAQALLAANMADVAHMLALHPQQDAAALARLVGSPGTYTALGLDHLQSGAAHRPWLEAMALVQQAHQGKPAC